MTEINTNKAELPKLQVPTGELSTIGLKASGGVVFEETQPELAWPQSKHTFNKMSYDPTIASANTTIKALVRKSEYKVSVKAAEPTDAQKEQVKFIEECMGDMSTTFNDVVNEALSFLTYGFSVHEKVFKYRDQTGSHKSLYNDGKVGWAKLPIRSQDSISKWLFDGKGRNLKGIEQNLSLVANNYDIDGKSKGFRDSTIRLPRKKVLHFRHDTRRNNPEGHSPLKACYAAWQYKAKIEEYQAIGVSRDLGGLPVISLPPEYMSPDAPADKKAVYDYYKDVVRNLHANEQAGLVLPKYIDPETKKDMFTFELVSVSGAKMYDTEKILNGYENKILMTYLADVLKLGQGASGSYALSDSKSNLLAVNVKAIIEEILQEFNEDLIPQTLTLNGWSLSNDMPRISVESLDDIDLDKLSVFVQRAVSVGAMEVDETLSDWLREVAGAPTVDRSKKLKPEMVGGGASEAGKGMAKAGEGNSDSGNSGSGSNSTTANMSNNS